MQILSLTLIAMVQQAGQTPAPADAQSVETAALANRKAVRSAYVSLTRRYEDFRNPADNRTAEAKIWLGGDRLRTDHVDHHPSLGELTDRRYIECFNCERHNHHLTYPEISHFAARLEHVPNGRFTPVHPTIDPRIFGYVADSYGLFWRDRIDTHVGRTDRADLRLNQERLNGIDCQVVRYTIAKGKVRVAVWYDPSRGYHPIKILTAEGGKTDDEGYRRAVVVEPRQVGSGLWYPRSFVFTIHMGKELELREKVDIADVRINEPIPPETFMIKGLGIADGVHFDITSEPAARRSWVWRDGSLITYEEDKKRLAAQGRLIEPEPVPLVTPTRPRYWLYAVAGVLAAAAVLFLWRATRKRSA